MTTHCKLDIFNNTKSEIQASATFSFPNPILPIDTKHKVIVTRADYSVNSLPIHYCDDDVTYTLRAVNNPTTILQTFTFRKGFYKSIREILNEINNNISLEIGLFKYNTNTGKLTFISKKGAAATHALYFPYYLKNLFDFFNWDSYNEFFVLHEKDTANDTPQEFSTIDRFFNRKAIRIEAVGLGAKSHIQNDTIQGYSSSTLLTDQVLLGNTTDRLVYIPSQFREIELLNNDRINSITINVSVEWANGKITPLTLSPDSYVNILLMFQKIT